MSLPFSPAASPLIGQPILIYSGDRAQLSRALDRALTHEVKPAIYTEDMFRTTHDAANREAVKAAARPDLNLVGLGFRARRKVVDKVLDGLKFHARWLKGASFHVAAIASHFS